MREKSLLFEESRWGYFGIVTTKVNIFGSESSTLERRLAVQSPLEASEMARWGKMLATQDLGSILRTRGEMTELTLRVVIDIHICFKAQCVPARMQICRLVQHACTYT